MNIRIHKPLGFYEIGQRGKQEDSVYPQLEQLDATNRVFVVCDGLGGLDHGDVASAVVTTALSSWLENFISSGLSLTREKVFEAVQHAWQQLVKTAERMPSEKSMGTTLTMLVLAPNGVVAAHIGDSRIYHLRPSTGQVMYRSRDHSLVNDLFLMGRLTRAEAEASPKKNILTRAMMPTRAMRPDVVFITDVRPGDYFMLCSDGVCGEISDKKIMTVLADKSKDDRQKLADIQLAVQGGSDNRTAILMQVDAVDSDGSSMVSSEAAMAAMAPAVAPESAEAPLAEPVVEPQQPPVFTPADDTLLPPPVHAEQGEPGSIPPPVPAVENEPEPEAFSQPEVPAIEVPTPPEAGKKNNLKRALWIVLAALILAGGITACFMLTKPNSQPAVTAQKADTLVNPDVTIDSVLPEQPPVDSLAVGTDVPVPPAPRVTSVPAPDVSYPTGSGVRVPRAERYDPYPEAFDDSGDKGKYPTDVAEPEDKIQQPATAQEQPVQQSKPAAPPAPPARPKVSADPTRSNSNIAVPPPPGKRRVTQAPY